jgi:hypothetical protein
MNCVENLPVYTAIVVCATVARVTGPFWTSLPSPGSQRGFSRRRRTSRLGRTDRVASMRFAFFFVQILCMSAMLVSFWCPGAS